MEERGHEARNVDVLGFPGEMEDIYTCIEDIKRDKIYREKIYMCIYYIEIAKDRHRDRHRYIQRE